MNPQNSIIFLLLFNTSVPLFYYYIFPISVTSFLIGYCWIHCLDYLFQEVRNRPLPEMSVQKAIFVYFQFIPLSLFPIFLAQIFGRIDLLENLIFFLNSLCISYILLYAYSICLAFIADKIIQTKYLWISSIFSLASVLSTLYVAFEYIAWKVDYGSWALAFVLIPLISYVSGTIARRKMSQNPCGIR